jgi:hypothetical protein
VILAEFETPSFTFHALAGSEAEARKILASAWKVHAKDTGADRNYLEENEDGINFSEIEPGVVLRDGDRIFPRKKNEGAAMTLAVPGPRIAQERTS